MHDTATPPTDEHVSEWVSKPVPEIARIIGISERYAWSLVHKGELASFKLGSRRFVRKVDLDAFLANLVDEERALRGRVSAVA